MSAPLNTKTQITTKCVGKNRGQAREHQKGRQRGTERGENRDGAEPAESELAGSWPRAVSVLIQEMPRVVGGIENRLNRTVMHQHNTVVK